MMGVNIGLRRLMGCSARWGPCSLFSWLPGASHGRLQPHYSGGCGCAPTVLISCQKDVPPFFTKFQGDLLAITTSRSESYLESPRSYSNRLKYLTTTVLASPQPCPAKGGYHKISKYVSFQSLIVRPDVRTDETKKKAWWSMQSHRE
jgi:hypothetical protein